MKLDQETKIESSTQSETKRVLKLEGSLLPHKGHSVFRKHKITGLVEKVDIDFKQFSLNHFLKNGNANVQGRINDNGMYTYGTYLNLENAKQKLK